MNWETIEADVNKLITRHFTQGRSGKSIDKIVVHHNAGNLTIDQCWNVWQNNEASAHYQVESGGRIGQLVWDANTAWHAGNWDANLTAIGVEHANDGGAGWTISGECLDNGAHLVAALCKYYELGRPAWLVNVFPHSYFSSTACPGAIYGSQKAAYMERAQHWYDVMTGATVDAEPAAPTSESTGYTVRVTADVLNIRSGAGTDYSVVGSINDGGVYTIVAESDGAGADRWGKLKSGVGWIALDYTEAVTAGATKSVDEVAREVIRGEWGNGSARKAKLEAAGYDYESVQARVNVMV